MVISTFSLWFVIGAIVALYSLIDDLFISKNKEVILYVINKHKSAELAEFDEKIVYKLLLSMKLILDTLFGPVATYLYFRKTLKMKKFRAEMQSK